ncbi:MAG: nucleotidyl transferase AbiEii/AbiGii toxin family protein [Acidobacteria bacterium]|nr:nucleotidyl transferase AbiEii/AbiGii toxin family protein [Acidobacteriota bacterium]
MITTAELHAAAQREGLRFDQVEKDYVILCVLSGLGKAGLLNAGWTFKGGTCLRHCYYAGYRFSEDIDFSCRPDGDSHLAGAVALLERTAGLVHDATGVAIDVRTAVHSSGQEQLEIPLHYSRGTVRRQALPAVRVHLTFDEPVLTPPEIRAVESPYPEIDPFRIIVYSLQEIVAEKLRSLLQQQDKWPRPRDLYDLWFILCHRSEPVAGRELRALFERKCQVRHIEPDRSRLTSETLREWNREAWSNQLSPMMSAAPDYERVWADWGRACATLF